MNDSHPSDFISVPIDIEFDREARTMTVRNKASGFSEWIRANANREITVTWSLDDHGDE